MRTGTVISIVVLVVLLAVGGYALSLARQEQVIMSFEECAAAGNPVMESYPRQCRAGDKTFVEQIAVPPSQVVSFNTPVTVRVNETMIFTDGLEVRLFKIDDSRCPPNANCIWAGELKVTLHLTIDGHSLSSEFYLGELTVPSFVVGAYTFTLNSITENTVTIRVVKTNTPATQSSGVTGTVWLGPTCPVERVPPDPQCADKGYATTIEIFKKGSSRVHATINSDSAGMFSASLVSGTYILRPVSANVLPYCEEKEVIVQQKQYTSVTIACDSGIR